MRRSSLVVATGARLDIESGHSLDSIFTTVGPVPAGSAGPGILGVSCASSLLTTQARLIVGDAGKGQLSITGLGTVTSGSARIGNGSGGEGIVILEGTAAQPSQESAWISGNLSVGHNSLGELRIINDSRVDSGLVYLGYLGGSRGVVLVDNGVWVVDTLIVGSGGEGELMIDFAGQVEASDDVSINGAAHVIRGLVDANSGSLVPSKLESSTNLIVGDFKDGELKIEDGALVQATDVLIGNVSGADGVVNVSGILGGRLATLDASGALTVAAGGSGKLNIGNNGFVASESGTIGVAPGSVGAVFIDADGSWPLFGDLTVGSGTPGADPNDCAGDETSLGIGSLHITANPLGDSVTGDTLTVAGPLSQVRGIGSVAFNQVVAKDCATVSPGNSPGTLTIDGDLAMPGGILEIEIDGLEEGQFDVLKVTGNADLTNAIVRFVFNRYLPRQGDQVNFLEATGTLTLDSTASFEYEGAEPGFEFTVTTDASGNAAFTANNNAFRDAMFNDGFE